MTSTLLFAFSGVDNRNIAKDVSLLLDADEVDLTDTVFLQDMLTDFLRQSGVLEDLEQLVITG